jgi:hypothetical protein
VTGDAEQYQAIALGVLIGVGAIVIGYVVRLIVPNKHFPRTAGLLASNAVIAALAYAKVTVAGTMLVWWLAVSFFAAYVTVTTDEDLG